MVTTLEVYGPSSWADMEYCKASLTIYVLSAHVGAWPYESCSILLNSLVPTISHRLCMQLGRVGGI